MSEPVSGPGLLATCLPSRAPGHAARLYGCPREGFQVVLLVFGKAVLSRQNDLILWLVGLHAMVFSGRIQDTFGFAGVIRVVLCSCSQA